MTINKQVLKFIAFIIDLNIGTRDSIMWEKTRVPEGNPHVRVGDQYTILHISTTDHVD